MRFWFVLKDALDNHEVLCAQGCGKRDLLYTSYQKNSLVSYHSQTHLPTILSLKQEKTDS